MEKNPQLERNLAQIYKSTWAELYDASPPDMQKKILAAKVKPDKQDDEVDLFVFRVCEKAEATYDKQLAAPVNK